MQNYYFILIFESLILLIHDFKFIFKLIFYIYLSSFIFF